MIDVDKTFQEAVEFQANNNLYEAESRFDMILEINPAHHESKIQLSIIAYSSGKYDDAERLVKSALSDFPCAQYEFSLGTIYKAQLKRDEAFEQFKKAGEMDDNIAPIQTVLFAEYSERKQHDEALKHAKRAYEIEPKVLTNLNNLINANIEVSDMDAAEEMSRVMIREYPNFWSGYLCLLRVKKYAESDFPIRKLESFIDKLHLSIDREKNVRQALGEAYESIHEYDKAFEHYKAFNDLEMREEWKQIPEILSEAGQTIRECYTKEMIESTEAPEAESPLVFVFGMPRSGTTLVEQTLVSHSDVGTVGETKNMNKEILYLAGLIADGELSPNASPESLTTDYISRNYDDLDTRFIIDKMPGNFNYIGLMYQMFPNAKFIHCKRDPADNCFSCWSILFKEGHEWSYDLSTVGQYYMRYVELMNHWESILPEGTIHTVQYEDMVADHEDTTKKLLEYIGLEWEDSCSEFYKVKRNVRTASLAQVTKPIYTTSVKRSSHFDKYLEPLYEELNRDTRRN